MKSKKRAIAKIIFPWLAYMMARFFWFTSRKSFHIEGEVTQGQCVVVCWHGELLMSPQAYRYFHKTQRSFAIISRHFDGEMIARVLTFFDIGSLRGSSSKGAKQVLLEAFRTLKSGSDLLVTPDGPRGPRYKVSDGAVALALKAKIPLVIINYRPSGYWQLNSWDKFVIPKPFCRIDFYLQSLNLEEMSLEEAREYLQKQMLVYALA